VHHSDNCQLGLRTLIVGPPPKTLASRSQLAQFSCHQRCTSVVCMCCMLGTTIHIQSAVFITDPNATIGVGDGVTTPLPNHRRRPAVVNNCSTSEGVEARERLAHDRARRRQCLSSERVEGRHAYPDAELRTEQGVPLRPLGQERHASSS
jgi:hypothetical protein